MRALLACLAALASADRREDRLYKDLMKVPFPKFHTLWESRLVVFGQDYNPLERPVDNSSLPVKVTLGVSMQQIVDLVHSILPRFRPSMEGRWIEGREEPGPSHERLAQLCKGPAYIYSNHSYSSRFHAKRLPFPQTKF